MVSFQHGPVLPPARHPRWRLTANWKTWLASSDSATQENAHLVRFTQAETVKLPSLPMIGNNEGVTIAWPPPPPMSSEHLNPSGAAALRQFCFASPESLAVLPKPVE